jgi:SAM-dependent methyltransferase
MQWQDALEKDPIYLNLGGGRLCHPARGYRQYISVDRHPRGGWFVEHDLSRPIPLPDESVDRLLSEHFIEHIRENEIQALLAECYRVLKPGGLFRVSCPDYANPKDRPALEAGKDDVFPGHVTLTHYALVKKIVQESPFTDYEFYQYWDGGQFIWKRIDYSLGLVMRTPENFYRLFLRSPRQWYHLIKSILISRWQPVNRFENPEGIRFGHPLYATSVVFDLHKPG